MQEPNEKVLDRSIRILLVARYTMVLDCLKLLIQKSRGLNIVGTHLMTSELDSHVVRDSDVAVFYMSHGDRIEVISDLLRTNPRLRVILLIAGGDIDSQAEALKLGAVGIVQKEQNPNLLIEAIRQTHQGKTWLNQVSLSKILDRTNGKKSQKPSFQLGPESLTARELEVVQMIGKGLKNKMIAEKLSICGATVRHHLSTIYGKTGVEDRLNLIIFAYQNGLIDFTGETEKAPPQML